MLEKNFNNDICTLTLDSTIKEIILTHANPFGTKVGVGFVGNY